MQLTEKNKLQIRTRRSNMGTRGNPTTRTPAAKILKPYKQARETPRSTHLASSWFPTGQEDIAARYGAGHEVRRSQASFRRNATPFGKLQNLMPHILDHEFSKAKQTATPSSACH